MSKNRPNIAEKIKFWEEQDKINQAFIPRVIEMSESLQNISKQSLKNSTKVTDQAAKIDQLEKKWRHLLSSCKNFLWNIKMRRSLKILLNP